MRIPLLSDFIRYFRIFTQYIGKKFYLLLVLTLLAALAEAFSITLVLPLLKASQIGDASFEGKTEILYHIIQFLGIPLEIYSILLLMGLIFVLKGLVKISEGVYRAYLTSIMMKKLKNKLFSYYARLNYQLFISKNTGHFINLLNAQTNQFIKSFEILSKFSSKVITTAVYLAVALYLNWLFSFMAILGGGLLLYFLKFISRYTKKISIKNAHEKSRINKFFIQSLHAMKYLKATARFEQIEKDTKRSVKKLAGYRFRMLSAGALIPSIREPFIIFFMIGIIIIQIQMLGEPLTPILVVLLLFYRGMNTMTEIQNNWQQLMVSTGGLEMTIEEFKNVKNHQEKTGKLKFEKLNQGIQLKDLTFAYENQPVLKNINLFIPVNKTLAFVGESGAGKTTLTDIISLLLNPQEGEIYIDNIPAKDLDKKAWRRKIGFVPQDPVVFDDTAANNINFWTGDYNKDPACREKTEQVAAKANCHDFIMTMKKGYNTRIGDRGVQLSGGQRQRLAIARELYKEPQLLIMDEATSSLDTQSERYIQKSIDELQGKMTVLIIAHRLSTIKNADHIYVLDKGKIIEKGSFKELTANPFSKFKTMTDMQNL
jgi:subfamily B ATP-binding cassette protein MsbA